MDLDKYMDAFINEEKQISPSPLLQSRIRTSINTENAPQKVSIWQSIAVAASIAVVIVSGFCIGSSYHCLPPKDHYMVINDCQIENLLILTNNAEE